MLKYKSTQAQPLILSDFLLEWFWKVLLGKLLGEKLISLTNAKCGKQTNSHIEVSFFNA